ncbi:hypothetical protein XELAEV_18040634mg [Xenopus laevis]|uniref:Ig-like domain-containing protein n=1 Tax=Xenopus laevis TaxID=8355 RepID=A0A974H934_XENLA|nr:hypothetical protein XELAEV_18040634mg [Xenopus laevis]
MRVQRSMSSFFVYFFFIVVHISLPKSVFSVCGPLIRIIKAEGENAHLHVNVTGTIDVYWNSIPGDRNFAKTKPNGELEILDDRYQGRLQGLKDSSLVIRNVTRRDEANYTADINRGESKCNQNYFLRVYKVLTDKDIQIYNESSGNETCNVTLTCAVNGLVGADVTVTWNNTNRENTKDPTIHLYNGEANSTYTCTATNPVSTAYRSIVPSIFCLRLTDDTSLERKESPTKRKNNRYYISSIPIVLILVVIATLCCWRQRVSCTYCTNSFFFSSVDLILM